MWLFKGIARHNGYYIVVVLDQTAPNVGKMFSFKQYRYFIPAILGWWKYRERLIR